MLSLLFLLAAQSEPILQSVTTEVSSPAYPYEIMEPVNEYLTCLNPVGRSIPPDGIVALFEADVARCRSERVAAERKAVTLLRPHHKGDDLPELVKEIFDRQAGGHISHGRQLDGLVRGSAPTMARVAVPSMITSVPGPSLQIPDEIAPAVVPFAMCRFRAIGVRTRRADGTLPNSLPEPTGENCSSARKLARQNALDMLERQSLDPPGGREAFVDRTLDQVTEFAQIIAASRANPAQ